MTSSVNLRFLKSKCKHVTKTHFHPPVDIHQEEGKGIRLHMDPGAIALDSQESLGQQRGQTSPF